MDPPRFSLVDRLRKLVAPLDLSPKGRALLEQERVESNRGRLAGLLLLLAVVQIATLIIFHPSPDAKHPEFRAGVFWLHLVTLPVVLVLCTVAWAAPSRKWRVPWLGDVVLCLTACLGALLSTNTHRLSPNLNAFMIALFSCTLAVRATLPGSILAYAGSAVVLVFGIRAVQPDPDLVTAHLTAGLSGAVLMFGFAQALNRSFAREVGLRLTIAQQKSELEKWNAELERRVQRQVSETLARSAEVRTLDAQLRSKVRDRSRELQRALRRTAGEIHLAPGVRFENRYEIERLLGEGAMGDVWAGRDRSTGQSVAIKLLRRFDDITAADLHRFVAEAAAAASVVHPAIVRTFHVDVTSTGQLYQVMEAIGGRTLASELSRGHYDAAQTARLGAIVAEALAAAHAAGVVHRDIKPGNLMLCAGPPGIKVLDFGISKVHDEDHSGVTTAGQMLGTPLYMAPEQIVQGAVVTGACDVYALGLVLYECLTGDPPFAGRTVGDVLRAQVSEGPMSVRSRGHSVPDDLSGLLRQCLAKAPEERPKAEALAAALRVLADFLDAPPAERIGPPRHLKDPGATALPDLAPESEIEPTMRAEVQVERRRS